MNTRAWLWGFLGGLPGWREFALVVVVTLVLYGRSGLQIARRGQGLPPWLLPVRRTSPSASRAGARANAPPAARTSPRGDRVFWFLAILAATAVAAWIVTRTLIVSAPKLSH
jgi:hypothetical protein